MAMCVAGLIAEGETIVNKVESAAISYPGFDSSFTKLGANVTYIAEGE